MSSVSRNFNKAVASFLNATEKPASTQAKQAKVETTGEKVLALAEGLLPAGGEVSDENKAVLEGAIVDISKGSIASPSKDPSIRGRLKSAVNDKARKSIRSAQRVYTTMQARVHARGMAKVAALEKKVEQRETSHARIVSSQSSNLKKRLVKSKAELAVAKAEVVLAKARLGKVNSTPDLLEIAKANSAFTKENLILAKCGTDKKAIAKATSEDTAATQHVPITKKASVPFDPYEGLDVVESIYEFAETTEGAKGFVDNARAGVKRSKEDVQVAIEAHVRSESPETAHAVDLATAKVTAAEAQLKCDEIIAVIAGHDDRGSDEVDALKTQLATASFALENANAEIDRLSSSGSSSPSPDSSSE